MRSSARYKLKRRSALMLSMLLAFDPVVYAQYEASAATPPQNTPAQVRHAFSQQELDQMLAPIALYPDSLLSHVLMASTYPLEVVQAARWSKANPGLSGDAAVRAAEQMDWDPSVKSLVAFPNLLQMMDEKLEWTERLGDAFLAQPAQVTDTVQNLRQKAYAAGNLKSKDQIRVKSEGQIIVVEPASPEIIYVPYYDPFVVYGPWWWPAYPPIFWAPWPGYYYAPAYAPGFAWGVGIVITTGFFFGAFDWHHHRVHVVNVNNYYYRPPVRPGLPPRPNVIISPGAWRHDPDHRRGVPYREPSLRQQFGRTSAFPEARRDYRGYDQLPSRDRPAAIGGIGGSREGPATEPRPATGSRPPARTNGRGAESRQGAPAALGRTAPAVRPHALEDIGRGSNVRDYSSRGRSSRERNVGGQDGARERQPSGTAPRGGIRPPRRRDE